MKKSFHIRLAELTKKRNSSIPLTDEELDEIRICELQNETYINSCMDLLTLIDAALIVGDKEWVESLLGKLRQLQDDPHQTKVK